MIRRELLALLRLTRP